MLKIRALSSASLAILFAFAVLAPGATSADTGRLAIKGYDPVAYFTMGRPIQGKPELEHTVDGVRYRFATVEHLEMFTKDSDQYAPQYRGLCAMGLGAKGYKVEANPENWVIHEGQLYVTQQDFGPAVFQTNPKRWVSAANVYVQALEGLPIGSSVSWW
jgi:hypothetical protein